MNRRGGRTLFAGLALALGASAPGTHATPGPAFVALSPGPSAGEFFVDDYLQDPGGWPTQAVTHGRGWSVAWRSTATPFGPERFILRRGGGAAMRDGVLSPRFAAALAEMLPPREAAILALLDPPDTAACSPGKPNPQPFERDGWLFLHDGVVDIEAITMQVWRADWGPAWEAFKLAHPRDYDGNGDSTRGNASEIYGLLFLHELAEVPGDPGGALERAIGHLLALAGADGFQFNAVALSPEGLWVARYAMSDADAYPIFYGTTTRGEHCVVDAWPGEGSWEDLPNFTLAHFPPNGPVELRPLVPGAIDEPGPGGGVNHGASRLWLRVDGSPTLGPVRLIYEMPAGALGSLELWTPDGRCVWARSIEGGRRVARWELPAQIGSGVYLARLRCGAEVGCARIVRLK
jgi:hypothetical protein